MGLMVEGCGKVVINLKSIAKLDSLLCGELGTSVRNNTSWLPMILEYVQKQ